MCMYVLGSCFSLRKNEHKRKHTSTKYNCTLIHYWKQVKHFPYNIVCLHRHPQKLMTTYMADRWGYCRHSEMLLTAHRLWYKPRHAHTDSSQSTSYMSHWRRVLLCPCIDTSWDVKSGFFQLAPGAIIIWILGRWIMGVARGLLTRRLLITYKRN